MATGHVLDLAEIGHTQVARVGGKGAHLGELCRIADVRVPPGFCITTDAFRRMLLRVPSIDERLDRLSCLEPDDREAIGAISEDLRRTIEALAFEDDLAGEIAAALARVGEDSAWAVRSSATAEDLATASFAGQHDTYLNVVGCAAVLEHVRRCWASLFTERAVAYRLRNGFDHRKVHMAVVVQRMVSPHAAGVLFTADPVTGHRKIVSIEASFGLGEALVSGRVNADVYKVRDGAIVARAIGEKQLAVHASPEGGTRECEVEPSRQREPALTDAEVLQLAELGLRIEAHFGRPQDIEWCLGPTREGGVHIVQSRPITALYPIPAAPDGENRVYISVGHQQMMTDPMMPLGLSLFLLTTPAPMVEAGGRLFVDVTRLLASPARRAALLDGMGKSDPLIRDALETVVARGDFLRTLEVEEPVRAPAPPPPLESDPAVVDDPATAGVALVHELIAQTEASLALLKRELRTKSGPALIEFIVADVQELKRGLFVPRSMQVIMAAMEATWWLNDRLRAWLGDGEKNAADTLAQSVPHNVTSEMGLALLEVADVIRAHPEVVAFLKRGPGDGFLDQLPKLAGGNEARDAIVAYLDRYGVRCVGEIDVTRPRWRERPSALLPMILANVANFAPGERARRFERGERAAREREQELLARVRDLPDGERKAEETKRKIDCLRTFAGYREYPKFGLISRYFEYKQALLGEADRLVRAGVLRAKEDIFLLRLQELHEVVRTQQVDEQLLRQRAAAFASYRALTPPRVLTSDGEVLDGAYLRDDFPPGALVGLAVSAGVVEGRARVVLNAEEADLAPGDILVTAYTDPSWTPLFVAIRGLVTEVGGSMTHGAVIARELGLPAVVGVEHATRRIRDGQRIRVHGSDGYVEILDACRSA
ncbi:MAG: phosphoenolpyruvate synthase [Deltaproteobacteria bacterium]|nr:phosphoenolpyruvate synthase [Deltaproteobacteria bacterium]